MVIINHFVCPFTHSKYSPLNFLRLINSLIKLFFVLIAQIAFFKVLLGRQVPTQVTKLFILSSLKFYQISFSL